MELKDLIVTPLVLITVYFVAYLIRPWVTDDINRVYFFPALTVRIIGALAVGFIYQFYYDGGDTYNYHTNGSRLVWEAFMDSPEKGFKLFFYGETGAKGLYRYTSQIPLISDASSYAVIRVAFIFDLFTFSSYSATAVLFGVFGFIGMWMFYITFYEQYPHLHRGLAIASFFIPSVFFWGSGLLKDTITLGCLGIGVYQIYRIFVKRRFFVHNILMLALAMYGLYIIKFYILLTFLPAAIIWIFALNFSKIRSIALKVILFPVMVSLTLGLSIFAAMKASEDNTKYSFDALGKTVLVTAYDIRYYTGKDAGSGYSLGDLDGSVWSVIKLAPRAVNVSLFRPYLWEVKNPLMLLSALESLTLLLLVLFLVFRLKSKIIGALGNANVIFLLIFAVIFSIGVGVSTFNFGTLVRYKIPMMPFFVTALVLLYDYWNRLRTVDEFDVVE